MPLPAASQLRRDAFAELRATLASAHGTAAPEAFTLAEESVLRTRFPGLEIVGAHASPFRELSAQEDEQDAVRIDASGAQVVFVGTGQPRQEQWMARMRPRLAAPMLIAVGAAFDFHAGLVAQAPPWMGNHGLEWIYRLAREPRRLWRRYARYNPRFVAGFARQYAKARSGLG